MQIPVWFLGWEDLWRRHRLPTPVFLGFPCGSAGKESTCSVGDLGLIPGLGGYPGEGKVYSLQYSALENSMDCMVHGVIKNWTWLATFWRRQWQPTAVLLPGKSHGRKSWVGCSPWGHKELDTTEQLHFHFSLSCIGEGNGNPLQCSFLENPRDRGAWWAAICGVAQSRTRLKRLSKQARATFPFTTENHAQPLRSF